MTHSDEQLLKQVFDGVINKVTNGDDPNAFDFVLEFGSMLERHSDEIDETRALRLESGFGDLCDRVTHELAKMGDNRPLRIH